MIGSRECCHGTVNSNIRAGSQRLHPPTASSKYFEMLSAPESLAIPAFASQRVRAASATVELSDRSPLRVVRLVFFLLEFAETGTLKRDQLMRQVAATIDRGLAESPASDDVVVDAASRFIVRGGRWKPTPVLAKSLTAAALGKVKCATVRFEAQGAMRPASRAATRRR
jgi:hypothetical protein